MSNRAAKARQLPVNEHRPPVRNRSRYGRHEVVATEIPYKVGAWRFTSDSHAALPAANNVNGYTDSRRCPFAAHSKYTLVRSQKRAASDRYASSKFRCSSLCCESTYACVYLCASPPYFAMLCRSSGRWGARWTMLCVCCATKLLHCRRSVAS